MTTGADFRATTFPLVIPAGSDIAFTVTATSDDTPVDLSAATIAAVLYDSTGDPVTPELSTVVSGAGSNVITLSLTDTQTAALTGVASWVLWVTRGGDKRPWLTGPVQIVDPTSGVRSTDGDAVTLTVDSDVNVSISVLAVGGGGSGSTGIDGGFAGTEFGGTDPIDGGGA